MRHSRHAEHAERIAAKASLEPQWLRTRFVKLNCENSTTRQLVIAAYIRVFDFSGPGVLKNEDLAAKCNVDTAETGPTLLGTILQMQRAERQRSRTLLSAWKTKAVWA